MYMIHTLLLTCVLILALMISIYSIILLVLHVLKIEI